jgi:Uma2 family endonuclease
MRMKSHPYIQPMLPGTLMTADELSHLHLPDKRTELVKGVLVVREPAGYRHGAVTMNLAGALHTFVRPRNLGRVLAAETGFKLFSDPDTVRAPDVAFIRADRIPDPPPGGFPAMAPDLAVEVLSPDDRPGEVLQKVADWLDAGVRLVWVVDPVRHVARVYRPDGTESLLSAGDALDGEDVVPGFSCGLAEVL